MMQFLTKSVSVITAFTLVATLIPMSVIAAPADGLDPNAPSAVSPADGATLMSADLSVIDWTDEADAVGYEYEISNTTDFSTPLASGSTVASEVASPGTPVGEYYWHVRTVDDESRVSAWSSTYHFTIAAPPAPPVPGADGLWYVDVNNSGTEDGTSAHPFNTIEEALDEVVVGDTIMVAAGTYTLTSTLTVNVADITITGAGVGSTVLTGSIGVGSNFIKVLAPGFTLEDVEIIKSDKNGEQNLIYVGASDMTVRDSSIHGQYEIGDGDVSRAFVFTGGLSGLLIEGNTIHSLRQPGYLSGPTTGLITNNFVYGTKGWVLEGGDMIFTDNTWGTGAQTNVYDIAIISAAPTTAYTDIVAMSTANNGAVIEDQRVSPAVLSTVYVDAATAHSTDLGGKYHPYASITPAIARVVAGGTIHVAAGSYSGDVTLNKALTLAGPNAGVNPNTGTRSTEAVLTGQINVYASNVTVDGLTVTNPAWNGVTIKGIHVYSGGSVISDIVLKNNILTAIANGNTKGSYGVMVQGVVDGVDVLNNLLDGITSQGWSHAIEVTPTGTNPVVPQDVQIEGNFISNVSNASGTDQYAFSVDSSSGIFADAAQVSFLGNSFAGLFVRNLDDVALDVSSNYWGDSDGPVIGQVTGLYTLENWYVDEDMTRLNTTSSGGGGGRSNRNNDDDDTDTDTTTDTETDTETTDGEGEVLGATTYNFSAELTIGAAGQDVTELQTILIAAGYLTLASPTGYFGPLTAEAVKKYQAAHNIPATGYVGPLTLAALNAETTPTGLDSAKIASLITQLQAILAQLAALRAAE